MSSQIHQSIKAVMCIFSQSDSSVSSEWIIADGEPLPPRLASSLPRLCSGHILKAEHGCTDTTRWEESTKPGLIKEGKLQRPCLTLIDLYQNTGIHVVQMLAHSAESGAGGEVNKHSLIRLRQRPSYHLSNLVMFNNSTLPTTGDFRQWMREWRCQGCR